MLIKRNKIFIIICHTGIYISLVVLIFDKRKYFTVSNIGSIGVSQAQKSKNKQRNTMILKCMVFQHAENISFG